MSTEPLKLGLVGARGYVGRELMRIVAMHPRLQLCFASSRELQGQEIDEYVPGAATGLRFESLGIDDIVNRDADVYVLALPNGLAGDYVQQLGDDKIVIDLSGDHRFDAGWHYGLPELARSYNGPRQRISNPGCYATAMQLALAPLCDLVVEPPHCFGVSGYSGAGTRPSPKNDTAVLANNLLPYQPIGHLHEREVSVHLDTEVRFFPHVAEFFRGISMTVTMTLGKSMTPGDIRMRYSRVYSREPLIQISDETPLVAAAANRHHASVGGWQLSANGRRLVVFATLDNLLKGAATQAMQNINLACGFNELEGINDELPVAAG